MSEIAIAAVQKMAGRIFGPRLLPRLELLNGVPDDSKTIVVIPTMLTSEDGVSTLVDHLEVIAIANRDPRIHFAILSDFADADTEHVAGEERLLEVARAGIERSQCAPRRHQRPAFRVPASLAVVESARAGVDGMGAQARQARGVQPPAARRDRHQLHDPRGSDDALYGIRYVITLDSDTQLPRDTAKKMIGIIAHPLNRPVVDPQLRRVTSGFGILQPRVSVTMASAAGSLFARTYAGQPVSIRTPPRCRTCIRTCSAKASSPARASTTSMRS